MKKEKHCGFCEALPEIVFWSFIVLILMGSGFLIGQLFEKPLKIEVLLEKNSMIINRTFWNPSNKNRVFCTLTCPYTPHEGKPDYADSLTLTVQ